MASPIVVVLYHIGKNLLRSEMIRFATMLRIYIYPELCDLIATISHPINGPLSHVWLVLLVYIQQDRPVLVVKQRLNGLPLEFFRF